MFNPSKYYTSVTRSEGKEMLRKAIYKLVVKHIPHLNPRFCTVRHGTCELYEKCDCGENYMNINGWLKKIHHE